MIRNRNEKAGVQDEIHHKGLRRLLPGVGRLLPQEYGDDCQGGAGQIATGRRCQTAGCHSDSNKVYHLDGVLVQ